MIHETAMHICETETDRDRERLVSSIIESIA